VSAEFKLELHLDSDEGNATGLESGAEVLLTGIDMSAGGAPQPRMGES
jgi:hypothetical protein